MQIRAYHTVVSERTAARISAPAVAAGIVAPLIGGESVEHFGVLTLNAAHHVIAWQHLTVGSLDVSIVHPRDVFRVAVLDHAAAVILAHNHPSGDVRLSAEDIALTRRLMECGALMGIPVIDHLVVGPTSAYASFKESGLNA